MGGGMEQKGIPKRVVFCTTDAGGGRRAPCSEHAGGGVLSQATRMQP